jgi:predicted outer membrane repeat protein
MKRLFLLLMLLIPSFIFAQSQQTVLYVSPNGNDNNSGLTRDNPLKTIRYALSKLNGNSDAPDTLNLLPGIYSKNTNGEKYELVLKSNICINGSGVNETILMGDFSSGILFLQKISNITIQNLKITSGDYSLGGGIYCEASSPTIKNVIISDCHASQGGAINSSFDACPTLINVLLYNNIADDWGGALYGYHAGYNLINVTISNNKSKDLGGGIYCQATFINAVNSIIWNNVPQQIFFYDLDSPNSVNISYSDIQDGRNGIWDNANGNVILQQGTNITRDPLFRNVQNGNYHLSDNSYCIGTGINNEDTPLKDIEGNARKVNPNFGVDLGAYENSLDIPLSGLLIADFTSYVREGHSPLEIHFINLSRSINKDIVWKWDFNNDGQPDSYEKEPSWIFEAPGFYSVTLIASDNSISDSLTLNDFITIYKKGTIWISTTGSDSGNGTEENPFRSIQRGIKLSTNNDTVLLEPGVYNENIDYKGKNIIIGSRFLLTKDTSFISLTRIKGNPGNNVVKFLNNEGNNAVLTGVTIENGRDVQEGGGIYCRGSKPTLRNLKIINNSSVGFGGGLACRDNANPILLDITFKNNTSSMGGGISCIGNSNPRIERVLLSKNTATWQGNALNILSGSNPEIINCTITQNLGSPTGAYIEHSSPLFLNSILWGNDNSEIKLFSAEINIAYSDIKGGKNNIIYESGYTINWLQNNINVDPEFEDITGDNFHLKKNSPCIDAGTDFFLWQNEVVLNLFHEYYSELRPDIGIYEHQCIADISEEKNLPQVINLRQNFPNPFNPSTSINYSIPNDCFVMIKIYDALGREIETLVNEEKKAGDYELKYDGRRLTSGIYFYQFNAGNYSETKKMILLK